MTRRTEKNSGPMDSARAAEIIRRLADYYGDMKPGLAYRGIYELTVAVVLSAQTTGRQVNGVTPVLFAEYPDFASLAAAERSRVEKIIHSTGFYRQKAVNIIALSAMILSEFGGRVPATLEELTRLPGVGRKSANVILSMGHGIPAMAVDTHVLRLANRLGVVSADNPRKAEEALTSLLPPELWTAGHLLLITHGRRTCSARKPLCAECPVQDLCDAAFSFRESGAGSPLQTS